MAQVEIVQSLFEEINKKFKHQSVKILSYLKSLESSPKKGKELGHVGGIVIKELKYESFRFYFITDGFKLRVMDQNQLSDLLIRFVKMSNKKDQQKTINEIKRILLNLGMEGFEDN